ncbi:MAG TPA: helix-turn-helix domain-containing protein, partial [Leptospiraceae bacterium]|nr:helix-turn-helix domain-containing protein [Leptospiraceae bacterium]
MKTQSKKRKVPYGMAREDIAAAARELFYEQGLATGLDEILKRADVSKPTFYHHFGSKEELESQYLTAQAEFLRTSVDRIAGKSRDACQFIRRWMEFIRRRASSPTFTGCPLGNFAIEAKSAHNARVLR